MRPLTAKTVRISPQLMGGMELEAQVSNHTFDGEFGAGHGMDDRERAVDHVVNDTPKNTLQLAALASKCAKCPANGCPRGTWMSGPYLIPRPKSSAILSTFLSAAHVFLLEQCPVQTPP